MLHGGWNKSVYLWCHNRGFPWGFPSETFRSRSKHFFSVKIPSQKILKQILHLHLRKYTVWLSLRCQKINLFRLQAINIFGTFETIKLCISFSVGQYLLYINWSDILCPCTIYRSLSLPMMGWTCTWTTWWTRDNPNNPRLQPTRETATSSSGSLLTTYPEEPQSTGQPLWTTSPSGIGPWQRQKGIFCTSTIVTIACYPQVVVLSCNCLISETLSHICRVGTLE